MPVTLQLDASKAQDVNRAAEILRGGGTVAFPTETVYGLGADALSALAVDRIFAAKQRPSWDPLIVHVADYCEMLALVSLEGELQRRVEALAKAFWPGPLTLLLPRRPCVPDAVTAGRPLVGVRVPAHPAAQTLLRVSRLALAAPSANRFGHTSPTTAQHVLDDLAGRIEAVLDGGATVIGVESTVLDPAAEVMTLYRPGAITAEMLQSVAGVPVRPYVPDQQAAGNNAGVQVDRTALPAPGVGLRHYAPRARLVLSEGTQEALHAALAGATAGGRFGVLLPKRWSLPGSVPVEDVLVEPWADWKDPEELAARLFAGLRRLDARGADTIVCPLPAPGGLRDALRDRLRKAARSE